MKLKTIRNQEYLVKTYYNKNGKIESVETWFTNEENAIRDYKARKRFLGSTYYDHEGTIEDVFIFITQLCETW